LLSHYQEKKYRLSLLKVNNTIYGIKVDEKCVATFATFEKVLPFQIFTENLNLKIHLVISNPKCEKKRKKFKLH